LFRLEENAEIDEGRLQRLLDHLRAQRLVLFVGAGLSKRLGYPLWVEYLEALEAELGATIDPRPESVLEWCEEIKRGFGAGDRKDDYEAHIEQTFGRDGRQPYDTLHLSLIRLGFRGFVTTNFDPALANTITAVSGGGSSCESLDLGEPRPFAVFDFLRALSAGVAQNAVLHLHGYYRHPERVVLAASDYRARYGDYESLGEDERPAQRALNTIAIKVTWAILVTHPVLFVGFSLSDEALRYLLRVTQADFFRGRHLDHFALVPSRSDEEEATLDEAWMRFGITPIYYRVVDSELGVDHSNLDALIEFLGRELGVEVATDPLTAFTATMLEL
jgi:hypothetical protein